MLNVNYTKLNASLLILQVTFITYMYMYVRANPVPVHVQSVVLQLTRQADVTSNLTSRGETGARSECAVVAVRSEAAIRSLVITNCD